MFGPLNMTTMTTSVVLAAVAVATLAWGVLDFLQSRALERIYRFMQRHG